MKKRKDYVLIPLTRGLVTAISPEDEERVRKHTWYAEYTRGRFYAATRINGKRIQLSRFLIKSPRNKTVDHWNNWTLDNRHCNLRPCTVAQNASASRKSRGSSKYRGVHLETQKKRWIARTQHKGKTYHIGCFKNEKTAAKAYDTFVRKLKGEFTGTNFPLPNEHPPSPPRIIRAQKALVPAPYGKQRGSHKKSPYVGVFYIKCDNFFYFQVGYKKKRYSGGCSKSAKEAALARDDLIIKNNWPHPLNFPKRYRRKK